MENKKNIKNKVKKDDKIIKNMSDKKILKEVLKDTILKLNPKTQLRNPVVFIVYIGAIFVSLQLLISLLIPFFGINISFSHNSSVFTFCIMIFLWLFVLISNFAEAMAEEIGKSQINSLAFAKNEEDIYIVFHSDKNTDFLNMEKSSEKINESENEKENKKKNEKENKQENKNGNEEKSVEKIDKTKNENKKFDLFIVRGIKNLDNEIIERMFKAVNNVTREASSNEYSLKIFLIFLTLIVLFASFSLYFYMQFSAVQSGEKGTISLTPLIAVFACTAPTTIGALFSPIGISSIINLMRKNILATSCEEIESLSEKDFESKASEICKNKNDFNLISVKLSEIKEIGKQVLETRGILTIFNIFNAISIYFSITSVLLAQLYPELAILNIMNLSTPESVILSSAIYSLSVIFILLPYAFKGIECVKSSANKLLLKNILIYGLGGLLSPLVIIKFVDSAISFMGIF